MFETTLFQDKVILITGGAKGIGRAIVEHFARLSAQVHFFYQSSQMLAQELMEQYPQQVQGYAVDITNPQQVQAAIDEILQKTDKIDILVNNSGIIRDGLFAALPIDDIKAVIDTNLIGTLQVTQAVVPHMMRKRSGKIINISSVAAEKGGRGQTNYAASKGAINAFTKSLAVELAKRNITVNAVAPGVIETSMSESVRDLAGNQVLEHILLNRYGQVDDIAHAVVFLASPYANYITGEILHVDGGFKMG
ncbi:MAG: 3-oxoacyl-ACP reductase FabG [Legionellales bacterium]|nr:3-oxoacyl-ACP reductase FabG [Legionellales bacterium]